MKTNTKAYTLLEVLGVSILLSAFLIAFMEGSRVMGLANQSQQNQNEAILLTRQAAMNWRAGAVTPAAQSTGMFVNGTAYTLDTAIDNYSATNSSLQRLSMTLSWKESRFDTKTPTSKELEHVAFSY